MDAAFADLPIAWREPVACVMRAAVQYGVPANAVLAVMSVEGAAPGTVSHNADGSRDIGRMQFNSVHLQYFARYGIHEGHLQMPGCYPIELAAWKISRHLLGCKQELWTCVARYHSKTPSHNAVYRSKLMPYAVSWAAWIKKTYPTTQEYRHHG